MNQLVVAAMVCLSFAGKSAVQSSSIVGATPLFRIPEGEGPFQKGNIDFFWTSASKLVLLTTTSPSRGFKTMDGMRAQTLHVFRVDVLTKKAERSVGLEQSISEWPWYQMKISPNGKGLICVPIDRRHAGRIVDIAETTYRSLDLLPNSNVSWFADSTAALDIGMQERADRRSRFFVLEPEHPLTAKPKALEEPIDGDSLVNESSGIPIGIRSDGTVVSVKFDGDPEPGSTVRSIAIHRFRFVDGRIEQGPAVDLPINDQILKFGSIKLNSTGDRILWQSTITGKDGKPASCLCTIGVTGTDYRQLVELPTVKKAKDLGSFGGFETEDEPLNGAEWMPDGKAVSFISAGTLYTILDQK